MTEYGYCIVFKAKDLNDTDSASKLRNDLCTERAKNEALARDMQLLKERLHTLERAQADLEVSRFEATRLKAQVADLVQVRTHTYLHSMCCMCMYSVHVLCSCNLLAARAIDVMRGSKIRV